MSEKKLKIETIELYKLLIPLKEPFIISLGADYNAENVIVKIKTAEGITGFGECSPYAMINGENQDTCMAVGQYIAKGLKEQNPLDIKSCIERMDKMIYGNSSIKSAFDMACYDITAQYAGLPLYKFLGGKNDKQLETDYTVSIGEVEKMAADAVKYKEQGYPVIKVKVGGGAEKDIERIKAIRQAIGNDIPLRIDANQGWKINEAIEALNALKDYNIQFCEEPVARWKFMQLRKVKKNSPIPVMADECCGNHHDAERLIELGACDMFNVKLGKSGGLYNALKIIRLAEKAGMNMQVGAFMESRLGMTAGAHLALCSDNIRYCDFDTPLMFTEDPVTGGLTYHENGKMKVPETAGLGATIDEGWLGRMEKVVV